MKKYNLPVLVGKVLSLGMEDGKSIAYLEDEEKIEVDQMQYMIADSLHGENVYAICNPEGRFMYFFKQVDFDKLTKAF